VEVEEWELRRVRVESFPDDLSTVANHAWRMPDGGSNRVMEYAMDPWLTV